MSKREILLAAAAGLALALPSTPRAAELEATALLGTWTGTYVCGQGATGVRVTIEAVQDGGLEGVFAFHPLPENPTVGSGSYRVRGALDPSTGRLTLDPVAWIEQPPGYVMVGVEAHADPAASSLSGRILAPGCDRLDVAREGAATAPVPANPDSAGVDAAEIPDALRPFFAAAADNPAAVPGGSVAGDPFVGNWALHIPGVPWISETVERDWVNRVETRTQWLTVGESASNAGALQIAPDGTYRIAWLTGKWQGAWEPNPHAGFGGLLLRHPEREDDDWIVFIDDEGKPQAREYPYSGFDRTAMEPIRDAALAEFLLTPVDPVTLAGTWTLWFEDGANRWEEGTIEIGTDGRYSYTDAEGRTVEGAWTQDGEAVRMIGALGDRDAFLKLDQTRPGRSVLVGNSLDLSGERVD